MSAPSTPSDNELAAALVDLRVQHPALGTTKLHAALLAAHPEWTVSEKRTKKVMQNEGLILGPSTSQGRKNSNGDPPLPSSRVVQGLDLTQWTTKVEVKYFGRSKGKGLVAKERITAGETVWKEDPFILAPEWDIYDLQMKSAACAHCSTPLKHTPLELACPGSFPCAAVFCSRLCLNRSASTHPLLCPAKNPASAPMMAFATKNEWLALHALARCTARLLLQEQQGDAAFDADWEFVRSLAQLGMEERVQGGWLGNAQPDRETWKKAYEVYIQAFQSPAKDIEKKKLARLIKKPVRREVQEWLFDYDAFLRGLGRMSLNLEAHGGLYVLHSHINHACDPNLSTRHLEQRTALSRISLIARRDIEPGEELTITYVNPQMGLAQRRQGLLEWGFGACKCARCSAEEEQAAGAPAGQSTLGDQDLELELKAGLGVL